MRVTWLAAVVLAIGCGMSLVHAADRVFVESGRAVAIDPAGDAWKTQGQSLVGSGVGNVLYANAALGEGDFSVTVRLSLDELNGSAASFVFGDNHFGFDGRTGWMFVEGPVFGGGTQFVRPSKEHIQPGKPFTFRFVRQRQTLLFEINGQVVRTATIEANHHARLTGADFGMRPWRATLRVHDFHATGDLRERSVINLPQINLFESGTKGYHTYRIPALITTTRGTILAFAEGRVKNSGDSGDIDLLVRRSTDGGRTWSEQQVVWDDGPNTCGNPCPVVDSRTGTIYLLMTHNLGVDHEGHIIEKTSRGTRTVWLSRSTDDGVTWSTPVGITQTTKDPDWGWYATGPGVGIQKQHGPHKGRLIIPANHSYSNAGPYARRSTYGYGAHVIYSDDGLTWHHSQPIHPNVNESQLVELSDGRLMMNMRSYFGDNRRRTAISDDGGVTWSEVRKEEELIEPVCQASIIRLDRENGKPWFLFANPASTRRENMTVRLSKDDAATWPIARPIYRGSSAYSCLAPLPDGDIGLLYEADGYRRIVFTRFTTDWLEGKE